MDNTIYKQTLIELRIDKIRQKLLFYDNLPFDKEIVRLVKQWRKLEKQLRDLASDKQITNRESGSSNREWQKRIVNE